MVHPQALAPRRSDLLFPVIHLGRKLARHRRFLQPFRPALIATPPPAALQRLPTARLLIPLRQIPQHDPPRHPIDYQVMRDQQQSLPKLSAQPKQHHPQQTTFLQLQTPLDPRRLRVQAAHPLPLVPRGQLYHLQCHHCLAPIDVLLPLPSALLKPVSQRCMGHLQLPHYLPQRCFIHRPSDPKQQRLIEMLRPR